MGRPVMRCTCCAIKCSTAPPSSERRACRPERCRVGSAGACTAWAAARDCELRMLVVPTVQAYIYPFILILDDDRAILTKLHTLRCHRTSHEASIKGRGRLSDSEARVN